MSVCRDINVELRSTVDVHGISLGWMTGGGKSSGRRGALTDAQGQVPCCDRAVVDELDELRGQTRPA